MKEQTSAMLLTEGKASEVYTVTVPQDQGLERWPDYSAVSIDRVTLWWLQLDRLQRATISYFRNEEKANYYWTSL